MKKYGFGVDLGGTTVKLGLFTSEGTLLEKWEIPTRSQNHGELLLPDITAAILGKLAEKNISASDVEGIGMGVPGAVQNDTYVQPCVNLDQWGGFDVGKTMSELCKLPVKIVNDANAAALGEMGHGGGKGYQNVVFVTLGTGVGGGIILNGKLVTGTHSAGGEIGHIKVRDDEAESCGCGKKGCLEQYASANGLVRSAKKKLQDNNLSTMLRTYDPLTCEAIFDCAKQGDCVALSLVDEMAQLLGKALAAISCVCDPEIFIIGGGVSKAGEILLKGTQKYFMSHAFPSAENTVFALAQLGNDAGIYGSAHMIWSK